MQRLCLKLAQKNNALKYQSSVYFISKSRLDYTLYKMGMYEKYKFSKISLKEFLFKNKLLYPEFLELISDSWKNY